MPRQPAFPGLLPVFAVRRRRSRRGVNCFWRKWRRLCPEASSGADHAVLSEGRAERRPSADAVGDDAAGLFPSELVCLSDPMAGVWANKSYASTEREAAFTGSGKVWGVMRKAPKAASCTPSPNPLIDAPLHHIPTQSARDTVEKKGCHEKDSDHR